MIVGGATPRREASTTAPSARLADRRQPTCLVADAEALVNDIRRQLGAQRPAVVSIDTLNRSIAGSESSDEDMSRYIRAADAIRAAFDCLVVTFIIAAIRRKDPAGIRASWALPMSQSASSATPRTTSLLSLNWQRTTRPGCVSSRASTPSRSASTRTATP